MDNKDKPTKCTIAGVQCYVGNAQRLRLEEYAKCAFELRVPVGGVREEDEMIVELINSSVYRHCPDAGWWSAKYNSDLERETPAGVLPPEFFGAQEPDTG